MKRELLIVACAVAMVAGIAGCSDDKVASEAPAGAGSDTSAAAPASSATPAAPGETRVIIGGKPQPVSGPVTCDTTQGRFSIAVGDMATGIIVGLEKDASAVHSAGFGTVDGVVMSFTEGVPGNQAKATKTGKNYRITGTASGVDSAGNQVNKPFEVDVTCP